jgi:hypothetical protein
VVKPSKRIIRRHGVELNPGISPMVHPKWCYCLSPRSGRTLDLSVTIGSAGKEKSLDVINLVPESVSDLTAVIGRSINCGKKGFTTVRSLRPCRVLSLSHDPLDPHVL